MNGPEDKFRDTSAEFSNRILTKDLFFYFLDIEVKRACRYQNFISILLMKLVPSSHEDGKKNFEVCRKTLSNFLISEMRETDILGRLGSHGWAALLPYADFSECSQVKARFEKVLDDYGFTKKGFEVRVQQFSYPRNETTTLDFIKKVLETETSDAGVMT